MFVDIAKLNRGDKFSLGGIKYKVIDFDDLPEHKKREWDYCRENYIFVKCPGYFDGYEGLIPGTEVEIFSATEAVIANAPKNNDGRVVCFWCPNTNTQKRGGGMYDVCPKCGR